LLGGAQIEAAVNTGQGRAQVVIGRPRPIHDDQAREPGHPRQLLARPAHAFAVVLLAHFAHELSLAGCRR